MSSDTREWYYLDAQNAHTGPANAAQLQELLTAGHVTLDTMVWAEGEAAWAALKDVSSLGLTAPAPAAAAANPEEELAAFEQEMLAAGAYETEAAKEDRKRPAEGVPAPEEESFVDDDGTHYVWDAAKGSFVPQDAAAAVPTYDESDMVFQDDEEVLPKMDQKVAAAAAAAAAAGNIIEPKKAKAPVDEEKRAAEMERQRQLIEEKKKEKEQKEKMWFDLKNNTSVYVTGLPEDVTVAEIVEVFGKCGIIKDDPQGNPRVKIYTDKATGMPKGDGLVTFLRKPSVDLALNIMHDTSFRPGESRLMSVTEAVFQQKGDEYKPKVNNSKKKQRVQKQEKNLGWGGFDDQVKREQLTVILKHMFTQAEVASSPLGFLTELEEDVAEECCKLGPITRLKVFGQHPAGVISVQFKTPEAATACVQLMHGRFFGGNQVEATLWDGITNYHLEKVAKETEEEQAARLEKYAQELEQGH